MIIQDVHEALTSIWFLCWLVRNPADEALGWKRENKQVWSISQLPCVHSCYYTNKQTKEQIRLNKSKRLKITTSTFFAHPSNHICWRLNTSLAIQLCRQQLWLRNIDDRHIWWLSATSEQFVLTEKTPDFALDKDSFSRKSRNVRLSSAGCYLVSEHFV